MPFGKHKGEHLDLLPLSYLCWLDENVDLREPLYSAVHREIQERVTGYAPSAASIGMGLQLRPAEIPLARRVFDAGYRALARATHPDVGGDAADMRALNALAESVRTQFRALEGV